MSDQRDYWFVQSRIWTRGIPVTWQGWLWVFGVFAAELAVTRELSGVARVVAFCAVLLGFFLIARGRTKYIPRDSLW